MRVFPLRRKKFDISITKKLLTAIELNKLTEICWNGMFRSVKAFGAAAVSTADYDDKRFIIEYIMSIKLFKWFYSNIRLGETKNVNYSFYLFRRST